MERASNARPAQSGSSANPAPRAISSAARAEIAGSSLILRTSHELGFSPIGRSSSRADGIPANKRGISNDASKKFGDRIDGRSHARVFGSGRLGGRAGTHHRAQ